jgi:hypothetical protein
MFPDPVVEPSLALLEAADLFGKVPVVLNADILAGPGGSKPDFDPRLFLQQCMRFPAGLLSVGWRTGCKAPYGEAHVSEMLSLLQGGLEVCTLLKKRKLHSQSVPHSAFAPWVS